MNTAMQNLMLHMEGLMKIGIVKIECFNHVKDYVDRVGSKEEKLNIKDAWIKGFFSEKENTSTAEEYFVENYK